MNRDLISALAEALTPTTLAAVVSDLSGQDHLTPVAQAFTHQLNYLVGEEEAAKLIAEASDPTIWPEPSGCEFCEHDFNRPAGNKPFACPYCGQRWTGANAVDPQSNDEGR